MKRISLIFAVVLLVMLAATGAFAGSCYINDQTTAVEIIPADVTAATATTNDIIVRKYHGQGKLVLSAEAQGSGITNAIRVQESALYTGATSTDLVGDTGIALNLSTGGTTTIGVTFTQAAVRQIKYVDLRLKKTGTIASDKVLTLTIQADDGGLPSNSALATAVTVLANGIDDDYQTVRFTFTTPYHVAAATAYWLVLTSNYSASDSNYITWAVNTVVSGGTAATVDGAVATQDPVFTVHQYAFADYVAFTNVVNSASLQSKAIDLDSVGTAIRAVSVVTGGSSTGAKALILVAPQANQ